MLLLIKVKIQEGNNSWRKIVNFVEAILINTHIIYRIICLKGKWCMNQDHRKKKLLEVNRVHCHYINNIKNQRGYYWEQEDNVRKESMMEYWAT